VIIAATLLITILLGMNVGHRRRHIGALIERAQRLARERDQQVETARVLERERISREMHDVIAHSLFVMIAMSDGAQAASRDRPEEARQAIGRVSATGRRTLAKCGACSDPCGARVRDLQRSTHRNPTHPA
jgi:signal transduction histidine kinase